LSASRRPSRTGRIPGGACGGPGAGSSSPLDPDRPRELSWPRTPSPRPFLLSSNLPLCPGRGAMREGRRGEGTRGRPDLFSVTRGGVVSFPNPPGPGDALDFEHGPPSRRLHRRSEPPSPSFALGGAACLAACAHPSPRRSSTQASTISQKRSRPSRTLVRTASTGRTSGYRIASGDSTPCSSSAPLPVARST